LLDRKTTCFPRGIFSRVEQAGCEENLPEVAAQLLAQYTQHRQRSEQESAATLEDMANRVDAPDVADDPKN